MRNYYMQFEETQTQSAIDDKIMSFVQHARPAMPLVSATCRCHVASTSQCTTQSSHSMRLRPRLSSPYLSCLQPGLGPPMPLGARPPMGEHMSTCAAAVSACCCATLSSEHGQSATALRTTDNGALAVPKGTSNEGKQSSAMGNTCCSVMYW